MPNKIIKASAGSGKTFQLSNEFLNIVFQSDGGRTEEKISSVLASTFTRKAAGEILDRILNRLAEAALEPKKQDEFIKHVPLPVSGKAQRTKLLQKTVAEIAKNLYRLRISTLDSFFNKIASSFALELALPPGWSIIDETEYERSIHEAVQEVIDESPKNEARKLLYLLQKGEQDRSIAKKMIGLAKELLPLVRKTDAKAWDHTGTDRLGELTLGKMTEEMIMDSVAPFIENPDYLHQLLPKTKKGDPDGNCVKDIDKFLTIIEERDWEGLLATAIGGNFAAGKFVIRNKPPEEGLRPLLSIAQHAKAIWAETIIHQTAATRGLLDLVWEKLVAILQRKRGLRFEDITFNLGEVFDKTPNVLPQQLLAHRMDAPTKHLLLDEFQDTSIPQWNILQPFVQSVIKEKETTFFCVGDLKQAIYSWRGGVSEIFETVNDFLTKDGAGIDEVPMMNETRRNSQPVMDAVNKVFQEIGKNTAVREKSPAAAAKWQEWFGTVEHVTKNPTPEKGYCVLEVASTSDDTFSDSNDADEIDPEKPFWKYAMDRIAQLHRKHPNRSIGVLFRANTNIPTVLKGLKVRKIEASDEGGIPLTDSAAVQQVLSVMTLLDHPGDTIARFHLANGPLASLLRFQDYADDFEAAKVAHRWRKKLLSDGYGKTVKELMSALTPCEPKEYQRLEKLLELAYQFDDRAVGTRTRSFVESVNAARLVTPSAASVRVMTIHKAKGLEFDIVVLPDLAGALVGGSGQTPEVIVAQDSPIAPIDFVIQYMNKNELALLPPPYTTAFTKWQDSQVKESLAVLYVAMTRARYELVMIVPDKKRGVTYSDVLQAGLGTTYRSEDNENWDDEPADKQPESPPLAWHALAKKEVLRNLPRDTPSGRELKFGSHESRERNEVERSDHLAGTPVFIGRSDAALRGTAIHACFANIEWFEEADFDKQTLQQTVEQTLLGKPGNVAPTEVVIAFLSMCELSEVKKTLMRSSYPATENIDVENERRFAVHWQGKLLHGSMDRLVIRQQGNEVIALEIIDFKSDRLIEGETLEERANIYAPQMEAYRNAVAKLYPNVADVSTKLVFTSLNKVVVIPNNEPRT